MDKKVTRASLDDRDLYAQHLSGLYPQYIGEQELEDKLSRLLQSQTLRELDDLLDGLPQPPVPPRPRDLGLPENFLPASAWAGVAGLTLAVIPAVALSGNHSTLAVTASALCMLWGLWIVLVTVVATAYAACAWDAQGESEKEERRRKDRQSR